MQLKVLISFLIEWYIQENEQIVSAQFAGYLDETEKDVISISYPLSCYHLAVLSSERTACPDSWRHSLVSSVKQTEWLVSAVLSSQQRSDFFFFFFFFFLYLVGKNRPLHEFGRHSCEAAMLIFSVSSQLQYMCHEACTRDEISDVLQIEYLSNAGCTLIFWFFYI